MTWRHFAATRNLSIFCLPSFVHRATGTALLANFPFKNSRSQSARLPLRGSSNYAERGKNGSTKGFGFIQPDNGGADAFVHISAVECAGMRELVEGQKIGFELERDMKSGKMSACNLQAA